MLSCGPMNRIPTVWYAALAALLLYTLFFVLLSVDVMARIWDWRDRFGSPVDAGMLLLFEGIRTVVTMAGIGTAVLAMRKARSSTAVWWLAWATAFTTIAYAKALAPDGFPGAVQERVAIALIGAGTPRPLLQVVFGQWEWATWLALGAFVLVAASWPRRLTSADVLASGARDRPGALRSVAVAGADVGSVLRAWTAALIDSGWLRAPRVWLVTGGAAIVHTALLLTLADTTAMAVQVAALALAGLLAAVAITLFRAGRPIADATEQPFIIWLQRGALSGLALFAVSAALSALGTGGMVGVLAASALALAPAVAVACLARAVVVARA